MQCHHSEESLNESSALDVTVTKPDIEKLERDNFTNNFFKNDFDLHIAMIAGFTNLSKIYYVYL